MSLRIEGFPGAEGAGTPPPDRWYKHDHDLDLDLGSDA
jgi:hypothetical protein